MMVEKRRKRFPWGWVWAGLVLAGAGGGGFAYQQKLKADAEKLPQGLQFAPVARGNIDQKITATGVVSAQVGAKVNIGSQISGRVRSLPADVGARVKAGQVVAVLDAPDYQAQVEQQRQNVSVAKAGLAQAYSRLQQALLNEQLSKEQTRAQIEEADSALKGADEQLRVAQAQNQMQPSQTASEITRAETGLSTAKSQERQVRQTVNLQLLQAQTSIDEAKVAVENAGRLLKRQQQLLAQGYVPKQEVDDNRTAYIQAQARLKSAEANLSIVKEKTGADLQAARDRVSEARATLTAARAGRLQDTMKEAQERSAREGRRQAQAMLALRRTNKTQDVIRRREVEGARSALEQAEGTFRQAQALLRYQNAQLDKAIIRSPISGTVLTVNTQQGETVAAGFQVQTLIAVADLRRLEVRAYVDEVDIGRTRIGLPAEVRVESFPHRVFRGKVVKIAGASTIKDNVVTYETTVAVDNPEGLLRPDMTADVTLILGRTPDVLMAPTESIHRAVGRTVVYVLHRGQKAEKRAEERTVQTGVQDNSNTQVVSGLNQGEEVITAGLARLGVKAVDSQNAEGKKEK